MTSTLKVLGQLKPTAVTLSALDTVPSGKSHVISTLSICNQSGTDDTFRISVAVAGAADDPKQYIYYDEDVPGNDTFLATIGLTLAATDVLRVYSTNGTCSFSAFGSEES